MKEEILGRVVKAKVIDENQTAYFVQAAALTCRLAKSEVEADLKLGDSVSGFVYENEEHHLQMTLKVPAVGINQYAFGEVVSVRRDLGVFVDIGLPNKDLAVSLDELPEQHKLWPKEHDQLMIALKLDHKDRMWGTLATTEVFQQLAVKAEQSMMNQDVTVTAYRLKLAGTLVVTADFKLGFIHPSERDREPRLGEQLKARVIGVRPDGILNLSLRPRAYEAIGDDAAMLIATLEHQGGSLPFWDKSSPAEIKSYFGISKGQFKRAIGHLLKNGLIEQQTGKILLKSPTNNQGKK
ncbi:CvfB family protein [Liquorilactobacillus ghanensis]|uniref:CvfB family protein n=1 Tax=Liquorilactobacillus ghanensis TaxID=399370 RepID=UPI0007094097|nr:S1-like domain-containing RNA-binding protein [Liquorilactobacillus ghanensis]